MNSPASRILIIGGVAAGASVAARARRLSESASILVIERGPDVSFANCGLPYHIGGEISDRSALAVQTPQTLKGMLNIEIRTNTEAIAIDRANRQVQVRILASGQTEWLTYDKLVLAPGAAPIRPSLPGIEDARILTLRNLTDMDQIKAAAQAATEVTVIGAGFIGLEMAEQLHRLGKKVNLVEMQDQILPPLDKSMTMLAEDELRRKGIQLALGDGIAGFEPGNKVTCILKSGKKIESDLVILAMGVRPETGLAKDAGLALGPKGHIHVDAHMRTSDANIYAAGDAVEIRDRVFGDITAVPLGGPANRQGRVIANHLFGGDAVNLSKGALGTAIVRVFEASAGLTGWTEKRLLAAGRAYRSVTVNDNHHAGYFPGAKPITLKLCWDPSNGRVLGAQVTGLSGVDKRLDVLATAIAGEMTIDDLAELELAYAPPFGSAKDIVNLAGFAACNTRDGLVSPVEELPLSSEIQILDVRPGPLSKAHPVPRDRVINIPLPELRRRMGELDQSKPIVTVCAMGKTSYFAARILSQAGFQVQSLTGGLRAKHDPRSPAKLPTA